MLNPLWVSYKMGLRQLTSFLNVCNLCYAISLLTGKHDGNAFTGQLLIFPVTMETMCFN